MKFHNKGAGFAVLVDRQVLNTKKTGQLPDTIQQRLQVGVVTRCFDGASETNELQAGQFFGFEGHAVGI